MWVVCALLLVSTVWAETRPRYGGTLRVETRVAPQTLDPAAAGQDPGFAQVAPLLYDTLVRLDMDKDASGRPMPSLATSWQRESEHRWRVTLRPGVHFWDGTGLATAVVAQSLHEANPEWNLRAVGDAVVIESEQPLPNLPAVLALSRNSIVLRGEGKPLGTGPFRVTDFQPGRRLMLAAQEDGWHARPFVDSIDIQFGRGTREQMLDLELGRADLVEVAPDQLARVVQLGRRVITSDPVELLALRFSHSNVRDARVRQALALALDRESIFNVLLQRHGEPAAGLLPNWMTGYSFLFPTTPQVAHARQLRAEAKHSAALTLVYDAGDPLSRLVAERIALNAADAGITLKTLPSTQNVTVPDVELVRVRLASSDPGVALAEFARTDRLALSAPEVPPVSLSDVYRASSAAFTDSWAVPLAYLPAVYALSPRVRNWTRTRDGSWNLSDVWLAAESRP
jgi:ABC-type transport system substrate-binding protein